MYYSYELPFRIHTAKPYPVAAPNESSIIIYGHEHGLTAIWRGGRRFRSASKSYDSALGPDSDGTNLSDAVMIIDSDEDEPSKQSKSSSAFNDQMSFDSEEEEPDPTEPYDPIIAQLNVPLRTGVLHLAIPPLPPNAPSRSARSLPSLFGEYIVVTAACADCSVHLITIPLKPPPSLETKQSQGNKKSRLGNKEVTVVEVTSAFHSVPRGVSLTWTSDASSAPAIAEDGIGDDEGDTNERGKLGGRSRSNFGSDKIPAWELIVAAHSSDITGLLKIIRVPLVTSGKKSSISDQDIYPVQTQYLPFPATSLAFNPSHYPSYAHGQVLLADAKGTVRIYNTLPHCKSRFDRPSANKEGSWLATFYSPFDDSMSAMEKGFVMPSRKRILDAQWSLNGKQIVVLLADGEWGVWDVEGTGPVAEAGLPQSMSGGGVTRFAVRGFVGDHAIVPKSNSSGRVDDHTSKEIRRLAPLTPKTRKVKQETLFTGPAVNSAVLGLIRGGIYLSAAPKSASARLRDQSMLLWYGCALYAIPSLMSYWQRVANSTKENRENINAGTLNGPSIMQLTSLSTSGELITSVSLIPAAASSHGIQHDVLISAEQRLVMLCPSKPQKEFSTELGRLFDRPKQGVVESDATRLDQDLLARGELDISGVDRLLDGLSNSDSRKSDRHHPSATAPRGRKVGFAIDY